MLMSPALAHGHAQPRSEKRRYGMDEPMHPAQIAAFRRMTTGQKLDAISQMYKMARWMLASQTRAEHPDWDAAAVEKEVSRRFANGAS